MTREPCCSLAEAGGCADAWALSFVLNEVALDLVTPTTVAAGRWWLPQR